MRQLLTILLVISLVVILTGCTSQSQETPSPADNNDEIDMGEPDNGNSENPGENSDINDLDSGSDPDNSDSDIPVLIAGSNLKIPGQVKSSSLLSVNQGETSRSTGKIALTFDAGWIYEPTSDLLDVLKSYEVKAAFFPRALWVQDNPDLARRIVEEGHLLGNHSLTHGHLIEMSEGEIRNEIQEASRIIKDITGVDTYLFRPPYGEMNDTLKRVLEEEGLFYSIMWTVDSRDWQEPGVDSIVNRVLSQGSVNGSIVLMHVGTFQTPQALPAIIEGFRSKGYQLTRLDNILPAQSVSGGDLVYTVQSGDTFYSLSRKFGVSIEDIIEYNHLRD